ncbi:GNAT family N-acetyltransferase [Primorskyibacter sp. S187A]|uniref:GNAT family N-acetyltransferase n=1 Tax=Primorskyibacter sp. S187A TaxID=3415130 RepID=UPI003C7D11C8
MTPRTRAPVAFIVLGNARSRDLFGAIAALVGYNASMSAFAQSSQPTHDLRQAYLSSLPEPQEWFLEELVEAGQFWTHEDGSYGVLHGQTLVEYFSADAAHAGELLSALHDQTSFSMALAKSFDRPFVQSLKQLGWAASVGGHLFRKRSAYDRTDIAAAQIRPATQDDVQSHWHINDDFFETEDEVRALADRGRLLTVTMDREIAGCGVFQRVIADRDAVDIGMMVAPNVRRKGLGTFIVCAMADRVEAEGLRPICGCGARNTASKATLEKAGFVSNHQLLSFAQGR